MRPLLLKTSVIRVQFKNFNIVELEVIRNVTNRCLKRTGNDKVIRMENVRRPRRGFPVMHPFPAYLCLLASQYYYNLEVFENVNNIATTIFSDLYKLDLNNFDINTLVVHEDGINCVIIKKATISYECIGERFFAGARLSVRRNYDVLLQLYFVERF